jgi:hypothetical protein
LSEFMTDIEVTELRNKRIDGCVYVSNSDDYELLKDELSEEPKGPLTLEKEFDTPSMDSCFEELFRYVRDEWSHTFGGTR